MIVLDIIRERVENINALYYTPNRQIILPDEAWLWKPNSIKLVDDTWILLKHTDHPSAYQAKMNAEQVKFRMEHIARQVVNKIKGYGEFEYGGKT